MLAKTKLEFGFMLYPYPEPGSWADLGRLAEQAEALGYFAVFFPEHLLPPPESSQVLANDNWPDSLTLATFMAARSSRLRFVPGVSVLPYHPPIQYAKQLATLDVVSGGRVILGVGTGWHEAEFERLGIPFDARGAITDEYLRAMVELWTAERPSFSGRYVSFDDVQFEPKPVQVPHIPLLIGGTGPRPDRRVVELGAGWYPMTGTREAREARFASLKAQAAAIGRDPDALWLVGNARLGVNAAQQQASRHVASDDRPARPAASSTRELIDSVRREQESGVDLVLVHVGWRTVDDLIGQLRRFSEEVIPSFR